MGSAVIQEQEIQAVGKGLGKSVDEELEVVRVQIRQFQEEASARRGLHGAIDVEPLKDVLDRPNRLHATRRETSAADGQ